MNCNHVKGKVWTGKLGCDYLYFKFLFLQPQPLQPQPTICYITFNIKPSKPVKLANIANTTLFCDALISQYSCLVSKNPPKVHILCSVSTIQTFIVYWVRRNMLSELKQRVHGAHQLHNLITRTSACLYPPPVPPLTWIESRVMFTWSIK